MRDDQVQGTSESPTTPGTDTPGPGAVHGTSSWTPSWTPY